MDSSSQAKKLGAEFFGTGALVSIGAGSVPATLGMVSEQAPFTMAQLGVIAFAFMLVVVGMVHAIGAVDYGSVSFGRATFAELIGTALLVFTVYGVIDARSAPGWAGFAIGGVVFAVIIVVGPTTGAAINPARHIGTVLAADVLGGTVHLAHVPAYFIGEFVGGLLGALAYLGLAKTREPAVATVQPRLEEISA